MGARCEECRLCPRVTRPQCEARNNHQGRAESQKCLHSYTATSPPYSALGALLHITSARKSLFGVRGAGLGRLFDLTLSMILSLRSLIFATIRRVVWLIRF